MKLSLERMKFYSKLFSKLRGDIQYQRKFDEYRTQRFTHKLPGTGMKILQDCEIMTNTFDDNIWKQYQLFQKLLENLVFVNTEYLKVLHRPFVDGKRNIYNSIKWRIQCNDIIQNILLMYTSTPAILLLTHFYKYFVQPDESKILRFYQNTNINTQTKNLIQSLDQAWDTRNGLPDNAAAVSRYIHVYGFIPMLKPYYSSSLQVAYLQLFKCLLKQQTCIADSRREWAFKVNQWTACYKTWSQVVEQAIYKWRAFIATM